MIEEHNLFMLNVVLKNIHKKFDLIKNKNFKALDNLRIEEGYKNFKEMCYASYGPGFYIENFGALSDDQVKLIYKLDSQNSEILEKCVKGDSLELSTVIKNIESILEIYGSIEI